jgi:hypothetical protein
MQLPRLAIPLLLLAAVSPALCQEKGAETLPKIWTKEPEGFQKLKFGDTEADVLAKEPSFTCMGKPGTVYRNCFGSTKVGDVLIHQLLIFDEKHLALISATFNSRQFDYMRPLFIERYGEPTGASKKIIQNAMGAKFENETIIWDGKAVVITFQKFSGKITESGFNLCTRAYFEKQQKDREEQLKRDATKM